MPQQAKTLLMGVAVGLLLCVLSVQWQPQGATSHRDALPQAAVKVVNRATELINEIDYRAFEIFDRDAFFNLGDRYVFVLAADGTVIYPPTGFGVPIIGTTRFPKASHGN